MSKIDAAVFYHLGKQIYACHLFKDGTVVGNMTDTLGGFLPAMKEYLKEKYPGISITVKELAPTKEQEH